MKFLIFFLVGLLSLGCNAPSKNTITVTDNKGEVIQGVQIWATFNSSNYAPEFKTNEKGIAEIKVPNIESIASLSLYYRGSKYAVMNKDIEWPLSVSIIDKNKITVNKK